MERTKKKLLLPWAESRHVTYYIEKEYPLEEFLKTQLHYDNRCEYCNQSRLTLAADLALREGYDAFFYDFNH